MFYRFKFLPIGLRGIWGMFMVIGAGKSSKIGSVCTIGTLFSLTKINVRLKVFYWIKTINLWLLDLAQTHSFPLSKFTSLSLLHTWMNTEYKKMMHKRLKFKLAKKEKNKNQFYYIIWLVGALALKVGPLESSLKI